jgi:hypothetical protein
MPNKEFTGIISGIQTHEQRYDHRSSGPGALVVTPQLTPIQRGGIRQGVYSLKPWISPQ